MFHYTVPHAQEHTNTHTHTHTHTCVHTHTNTHCTCSHTHTHIYAHTHVHTYTSTHTHTLVNTYTLTDAHLLTQTLTFTIKSRMTSRIRFFSNNNPPSHMVKETFGEHNKLANKKDSFICYKVCLFSRGAAHIQTACCLLSPSLPASVTKCGVWLQHDPS